MKTARMTMRIALAFLFSAVLLAAGCEMNQDWMKGGSSATATAEKPVRQGWFVTILIDGQQTQPVEKTQNPQLWTVPACSATPTISVNVDQDQLGPGGRVSIIINPIRDGLADPTDQWVYVGKNRLEPGRTVKLDLFLHTADNVTTRDIRMLAPGKYRFVIQANGAKSWDKQHIDVEIR